MASPSRHSAALMALGALGLLVLLSFSAHGASSTTQLTFHPPACEQSGVRPFNAGGLPPNPGTGGASSGGGGASAAPLLATSDCGGVPTTSLTICLGISTNPFGPCSTIAGVTVGYTYTATSPDLNPAHWVSWIWCSLQNLVYGAINAAIAYALYPVWLALGTIQNFIANIGTYIWNAIVGFFNSVVSTIESGISSFFNVQQTTIGIWLTTGFGYLQGLLNQVYTAIANIASVFGPFAPPVAIVLFFALAFVLIFVTIWVVRLLLAGIRTVFNLL